MEYRIHSNNGIKTSVIGLNFTNFKFFEENYKKQIIGSILEIANKHKLNFISIPSFNDELLRTILEWKKVNNWEPIISIQIGFSAIDYKTMNKLYDKKIIFQNRFENIVEEASKLLDTYQIDKIQFLSLFYPKLDHIKQNDFDAIQKELKKTGIVQSVGIHCQFVSDAILLANRINIDFIELEIDINTSSDIINSLFKICQR